MLEFVGQTCWGKELCLFVTSEEATSVSAQKPFLALVIENPFALRTGCLALC